ncbi:SpoVA/SpoVAEb family sporulation membrane protein, partial [Bacillus anthracis]
MSSKDKNLTPVQQEYKKFEQEREPKRPVLKNCIKAFFVGGFICFIGQLISTFYITYFDFTERSAGNPTVATLIFISMLLTGFGIYDRFGQFAGAGTA